MAENENRLVTEVRESFGKGAARKIRSVGKIPAVIYGHGTAPQHVTLPGHEVVAASCASRTRCSSSTSTARPSSRSSRTCRRTRCARSSSTSTSSSYARASGSRSTCPCTSRANRRPASSVNQDANTISLEVEATHIPENVVISIEGLEEGSQIHAKDVALPAGATLVSDPETLIVGITGETAQDLGEETAAEAAAEPAGAEEPPPRPPPRPPSSTDPPRVDDHWLVVGLGNPGPGYAGNRHNVGQMVLAAARGPGIARASRTTRRTPRSPRGAATPAGPKLVLAKPNSFMNLSGGPVAALLRFYKIEPDHLIVLHDELDIPFDTVRLKRGGGHGGHNGVRDITAAIGTGDFTRVRLGIGRPPAARPPPTSCSRTSRATERETLPNMLVDAADAVELIAADGARGGAAEVPQPRPLSASANP